jgi:uncharacterized protein (TIGR02646 family)
MIRIKRGPAPEFLSSEIVQAAKNKLSRSFENSARQERFRFEVSLLGQVKKDLMKMCNNKCAYCESRLDAVSYGDVENFRPKSGARGMNNEYAPYHYWWLAYEWDNLLVACQICNQKYKRDYFPLEDESLRAPVGTMGEQLLLEKALLIDPSSEKPEQHLRFLDNGMVEEKTKKGKCTIEIMGLNRENLVRSRREAAENLKARLELARSGNMGEAKKLLQYSKELYSDHPPQEYAATLKATFTQWFSANINLWSTASRLIVDQLGKLISKGSKFMPLKSGSQVAETEQYITESEKIEVTEQLLTIKRFSIKSIEIENFKSIEKLSLQILPTNSAEARESWLLLLGDNGIGKSSILQAVALALAGRQQLDRLNLDVTDYLKYGTTSGFVKIQSYEHNNPVELHFNATSGFSTDLTEPPTFLLAYGSTRLLPKGPVQPERDPQPYSNIANLFDYSIALCNPHIWLGNLNPSEFKERVAPAFFDVLALRGDDRLFIENGKIVIQQFGAPYELEDNSDGYKTIVALITDIMKTLSADTASYHNAQGIVLIDEIGNHLHPRWRLKIVSALRRAFPKLQFIVTTHEPLCLRGLAHGEVVVLVRDHEKKIRALDKELLPDHNMMRIDQLLTSDLFGLINIMDEETEKSYEEYYNLLSKKEEDKTEEDKQKILDMSTIIAEKEVLGTTPDEQVMYKVINETFAKKIRDEGFKTKEELKKQTVEEVKSFIKSKKYNWL